MPTSPSAHHLKPQRNMKLNNCLGSHYYATQEHPAIYIVIESLVMVLRNRITISIQHMR